jgi:hypothetical protein
MVAKTLDRRSKMKMDGFAPTIARDVAVVFGIPTSDSQLTRLAGRDPELLQQQYGLRAYRKLVSEPLQAACRHLKRFGCRIYRESASLGDIEDWLDGAENRAVVLVSHTSPTTHGIQFQDQFVPLDQFLTSIARLQDGTLWILACESVEFADAVKDNRCRVSLIVSAPKLNQLQEWLQFVERVVLRLRRKSVSFQQAFVDEKHSVLTHS